MQTQTSLQQVIVLEGIMKVLYKQNMCHILINVIIFILQAIDVIKTLFFSYYFVVFIQSKLISVDGSNLM